VVRIRILLVDDHELIRRNIRRLLSSQADFEVIAEAATGLEAIREAGKHQPDMILLDIGLPELNGLAALPLIRKAAPAAKVLMVTNHEHPDLARASFSAGAHGFLTKSDVAMQLGQAIRQVLANETFLSKSLKVAEKAKPSVPSLDSAEA
jgi:two-component system, NarL family, nitrate/nitrite response regulator NarL